MKLKGNTPYYGLLAKLLHWLVAILLLCLCGLGFYMTELDYYDANYKSSFDLHRSLGVLTALLIMLRIFWATLDIRPKLSARLTRFERIAATATHHSMYLLMVMLPIAGYLVSTADGRAVEVFGWLSIPALLAAEKGREEWAGDLHEALAITLLVLIALHLAAVLKHHFIDKDDTLKRML